MFLMSSPGLPPRRHPHRWWRVFIAFVLIVGVNFAMFSAWQKYLPELSLFPSATLPDEVVQEETVVVQDIAMSGEITGQVLANRLLRLFPNPGEEWKESDTTGTPVGTVVDTVCPVESLLAPAVQEQSAWRTAPTVSASPSSSTSSISSLPYSSTSLNGIVAQVRIYKAGLGAVAMKNLRSQVMGCVGNENWDVSWGGELTIGQESFYYRATGDSASQTNVVFREGDILGVVSVRGYADAGALADEWNSRWGSSLKGICLNTDSTLKDASRQPLYKGYEGYVGRKTISLTDSQIAEIEARVAQEQRNAMAGQNGDIAFVAEPAKEEKSRENVLELPEYTAAVDLPEAPATPNYPAYPQPVPTEGDYYVETEDLYGPGCGWALTGQAVPPFSENLTEEAVQAAQQKTVDTLTADYAAWLADLWKYTAAYDTYVAEVNQWNMWVTLVTPAIAKAEWDAYDIAYADYDALQKQYVKDKQEYDLCLLENPLPSPSETPSPAPTESPTPSPEPSPSDTPTGSPEPSPTLTGPSPSPASAPAIVPFRAGYVPAARVCPTKPVPPVPPTEPAYSRPLE